jgi:hypothetical protein
MNAAKAQSVNNALNWTPALIRMLRGKRTQTDFGKLIHAPKNTVWRWEAGFAKPDAVHAQNLSKLAKKEGFLEDWQLVGSMTLVGDIEAGSKEISQKFRQAIHRSAQQLAE